MMKQLHKQTSVNHRRDEENPNSYSPKSLKHPRSFPRSIHYILKEQRLLFIFVGILIGSTFFVFQPTLSRLTPPDPQHSLSSISTRSAFDTSSSSSSSFASSFFPKHSFASRVPAAVGRRRLRIVVTGGAGFVGSHLVDKLIARGDEVIVIDNFFTGRKENLVHLFGNPRFELIRHDVVEPILLEVDQIYHLACPASPVHYKYNPVKTIISFYLCCHLFNAVRVVLM
ncbi:UDP-glucuronic acid decarboxylase 1 [Euphorbia peplus]|nr:UDP-glucuronic acid decarboxylase 1 [Euphorbia peplus]